MMVQARYEHDRFYWTTDFAALLVIQKLASCVYVVVFGHCLVRLSRPRTYSTTLSSEL